MSLRTDLAVDESEKVNNITMLKGLKNDEAWLCDMKVTKTEILDKVAATEFRKPIGKYVTIEFNDISNDDKKFTDLIEISASELSKMLHLKISDTVLVVCLGNNEITPDSLGPKASKSVIPTRHIKEKLKKIYSENKFAPVAIITPGVLGQTGIETAEIVRGVVKEIKPKAVIVIDALMSTNLSRLAKTIQITDSGIIPGGADNKMRAEISKETLKVPVISIGVPTVVDAATITKELIGEVLNIVSENEDGSKGVYNSLNEKEKQDRMKECLSPYEKALIVTPNEIDFFINEIAKVIGYTINKALHNDISIEDMQMLIS
ncbi:MAG: GPR endopeptidase [Clostridia bacterium]